MPPYVSVFVQNIGDKQLSYVFAGTENDGKLIADVFDHGTSQQCVARMISIQRRRKNENAFTEILKISGVEVRVIYTDCRVVFRCDKYDVGSTWSRAPMAFYMNHRSQKAAKKRMAGKVLLGHIRYEWLKEIAYIDRSIRFVYRDMEDTTYFVETVFDQNIDTSAVSNEILHRACRFLLSFRDEKDDTEICFLNKFSVEPIIHTPEKGFSIVAFPSSYLAPDGKAYRPLIYDRARDNTSNPSARVLPEETVSDNSIADGLEGISDEKRIRIKEYEDLMKAGIITEQLFISKKNDILKSE